MASLGEKSKHNPKQDCGGWNRISEEQITWNPRVTTGTLLGTEMEPTGGGGLI